MLWNSLRIGERIVERERAGVRPAGTARSSPAPSSCSRRETADPDRSGPRRVPSRVRRATDTSAPLAAMALRSSASTSANGRRVRRLHAARAETLNHIEKQGEAHGDCAGGAHVTSVYASGMARKARPSGALNGTKVVVLGAGLAGLAAARALEAEGAAVIVARSAGPCRRPGPYASDRVRGRPARRGRRGPDRIDAVARARARRQTWV